MRIFDLHEDEWGMIDLVPVENAGDAVTRTAEARAHGEAHRAPGLGWTAIYMIPETRVSIAGRALCVGNLEDAFPSLRRFDRVVSGYSSFRETIVDAFALGDDTSVLYGNVDEVTVTRLHLHRPSPSLAAPLCAFAAQHRLIAADWWRDELIDLADRAAVERWLAAE